MKPIPENTIRKYTDNLDLLNISVMPCFATWNFHWASLWYQMLWFWSFHSRSPEQLGSARQLVNTAERPTTPFAVTPLSFQLSHVVRKTFTPSCSDFLSAGWRRGSRAVENGCCEHCTQLRPFAMGKSVSRCAPAGPEHADEGQHLCSRELGISAGKTVHRQSHSSSTSDHSCPIPH